MNPAFDDEDIFRQFDYHPPNNRSSNRNARQSVSKTELLEILDMVKSSLERAWFISCGGQRRKLKRMEALEELKQKIEACPDDMNLSMVLENTIAPTSCVSPLFGRNMNRVMERQLNNAVLFLDEHLNTGGDETDDATIGDSLVEDDEELEMMTARSQNSSETSSVFTNSHYDADSEKGSHSGHNDVDDGLSETTDDVVVTTCNVENDLGALGLSITTWSRRKLNTESMRSRSVISGLTEAAVAEAEGTSDSDGEDYDENGDEENNETVEEVSISIGDKIVVHASRNRSVRFTGIKPSTEDNINRAMELLQSAKLMREKMSS